MYTCIIPTRDRPGRLLQTLAAIGRIPAPAGAEVIVVDNASRHPPTPPERLASGVPVRTVLLGENLGAAARNIGAREAGNEWLLMIDDDSCPLDGDFAGELARAPADVHAVGAEIVLADGRRESGGLPEVFIGCGVAIRRGPFLAVGGYDRSFVFYAEEYDLAARLIAAGGRVVHSRGFRVRHHKDGLNRDMNEILRRLVRNNGWVALRHAPDHVLDGAMREVVGRYRRIAEIERATEGYERGLAELRATAGRQPRTPLSEAQWDRFEGLAAARARLRRAAAGGALAGTVAVVDEGKNSAVVRRALAELGVAEGPEPAADALVIGTLSPGPMMDAAEKRLRDGERRSVVTAWEMESAAAVAAG
ncbi:MAG: glycosyltransferase [Phycisphaerales bacterium]|nr:glycosyltransferase [Phycisphaerales bacterium]